MNSKMTSIISCLGIPGLIVAAFIYNIGDDKSSKYYLIQSLNAVICSLTAREVLGLAGAISGGGFSAWVCGVLASIYGFALFVQILISAIKQSRPQILGLVPVVNL